MASFKHFLHPPVGDAALKINGVGVQEQMRPGIVDRPKGTGDWLFMVFYDEVTLRVRDEPVAHPPTHLMIWTPRHGHYYGNRATSWSHSWLHCEGKYVARHVARESLPVATPIRLPDPSHVDRYLLAIHTEVTSYARPDMEIVRDQFHCWVRETARIVRGAAGALPPAAPAQLVELRTYLDTHYDRPQALPRLAERARMSVPHLCSEFKKHFGVPVIEYVIRRRMREAAYLLHDRNLNITGVARRVGYSDIFHFSKLFKKHFGRSPRDVRKSYLGGSGA